jgi:glycosyltransferase involved in cell wall biosynthesis
MEQPLVTVICLCYNHAEFVTEALQSVLNQTYKNIQIIIVDDASIDTSVEIITGFVNRNPTIEFRSLEYNIGNCKAFNEVLSHVKGKYVIDFATDDVMLPEKIQHQVEFFQTLSDEYGVVFTDAIYIDANGKYLRSHFDYLLQKSLIDHVPQGDIYRDVLSTYFIPSPSMMIRRAVLEKLNGYDENLSYEDFDFWVRSSRHYRYAFLNEKSIKIRRKTQSMSTGWYKDGDTQLHSTYLVCKKATHLNKWNEDWDAWCVRVRYEFRQSIFSDNYREAYLFFELLDESGYLKASDKFLLTICKLRLPLSYIRRWYHQLRYQPLR